MTINIQDLLGDEASDLLEHVCTTIPKALLNLPGPDFVERVFSLSDRSQDVEGNLGKIFGHGRLKGTGYLSILPVDQGVEHTAGASFAPNPIYFDPANIVKLAVEGAEALPQLQELADNGLGILVCGPCLKVFNLFEKRQVGELTSMLDIITSMQMADKVISLT